MMSRLLVSCVAVVSLCACTIGEEEDSVAGDGLAQELYPSDGDAGDAGGQPRARVCAAGDMTKGIDISKWQGTINWPQVKADGVRYAFIRLSDGANTKDAKFTANWSGAKAAGIIRGAYQFFRPTQSVTTQADMMIAAIGTYEPGDLPPVIDVEDHGGLSPTTLASRVRVWVDRVQAALGVTPVVYTGKYFWRDEVGSPASFAPNALWIAQYTSLCPDIPRPWAKWTFWQHTDKGAVAGISGPVDMNRFNGSLAELQAFAGGTPVKPLTFGWQRNATGSYLFTVTPPPDVAKVELRVADFLIGTALVSSGTGTLTYTFNVATANRVIEARGIAANGAIVAVGNGIIDSLSSTALFVRQTGEHEYEIGLERAPASWATVEVEVDGFYLTDLDTQLTRSTRAAVRYKFNGLGQRPLRVVARDGNGTIVDTRMRSLLVR